MSRSILAGPKRQMRLRDFARNNNVESNESDVEEEFTGLVPHGAPVGVTARVRIPRLST